MELTPLQKAQQKRKEMSDAGIKVVFKTPSEKAKDNPTSLRLAVNGNCYECMGGGGNPNFQWLIGNCESDKDCSLWNVRPYQKMLGNKTPEMYL